jgi:hypothetical protein
MKKFGARFLVFLAVLVGGSCGLAWGDFVVSAAVDNLVRAPADLFDLQGKTVRFTPMAGGGYQVQTLGESNLVQGGTTLEDGAAVGPWDSKGWSVAIPFAFPFGGKKYDHLFVNMDGNITFDQPESVYWAERNPWADGGMVSVGAALDGRSAAGLETMIAAFWGPYQNPSMSQISARIFNDCLAVTWNMTRAAWGQAVLGVNTFQARLYASGVIELTYPHVAERDGIVGVFSGQRTADLPLSDWEYRGKAPDPSVDIDSGDVYDGGTVLDLALTMKGDVPTSVDSGTIDYRCWINHDGVRSVVDLGISDQPRMTCWLGPAPRTGGWRIEGKRVDMYISKLLLAGSKNCSVGWDVIWWGKDGRFSGSSVDEPVQNLAAMLPGNFKFSTANESHRGNIYEVFHYPMVSKASEPLLKSIYAKIPPRDDIAIVFTDFRIDDLYGQGPGAFASNVPIQGIGKGNANPRSTKEIGSTQLQMNISTVWLGSPMFAESGRNDDGTPWYNFGRGVKWIAHECTHRWGMDMSFVNPNTGKTEKLVDSVGHWRQELDTTAMFPVTELYLQQRSAGGSIMGGGAWRRNSDGTFSPSDYPYQIPGGYSPLDLYVMGMVPAARVGPMLLIEDLKDLGENRFSGSPVQVRMEDILAVMGQRVPAYADAQRQWHMTFYIVHEPGREADPGMVARAQRLALAVANFFYRATGGVMRVVPSGGN